MSWLVGQLLLASRPRPGMLSILPWPGWSQPQSFTQPHMLMALLLRSPSLDGPSSEFQVVLISLQFYFVLSCSVVSDSVTPWTVACQLLCLWNSPSKNNGLGCHFLLQGIFSMQDRTHLSCIVCIGRCILYHCATWEALILLLKH